MNDHDLRFFENPHPNPLPKGEGEKAAIRARVKYIEREALKALSEGRGLGEGK